MRNKKQEKILSMIDGYDSTETLSAAMAGVFLVWLLAAAASVAVAFMGFVAGTDADAISDFRSMVRTLQVAEGLLGLFTAAFFVYWVFRARENVRRLGKRHKIGLGRIFLRHIAALVIGFVALVVAFMVPAAATLGVTVFVVSMLWFSLMFSMMAYASMQMLWRTSSAPTGTEDELPALGFVWLVTWVLSGWTGGVQQQNDNIVIGVETAAIGLALHGVFIAIAAFTVSLLVRQVAARQESRLDAIISYVDIDVAGTHGAVTTDQINDAWDASDNLVDFNN